MKKFLITLIGVVILSQSSVQISNSRPLFFTTLCIDGYKYLSTVYGYAAISTIQMYEQAPQLNGVAGPLPKGPQPIPCKEKQ